MTGKLTEKEIFQQQTDTNKVLFILYDSSGITSKEIADIILSYSSNGPNSPKEKDKEDNKDNRTDIYIRDYLNKYLKRLLNKGFIQRDESKRPYTYSLTQQGKDFVSEKYEEWRREVEEATIRQRNADEIGERIAAFEDYLKQNYIQQKLLQAKKFFQIDIKDLAQFNPRLCERLTDDFDETHKCLQIAYTNITDSDSSKISFTYDNLFDTEKRTANQLRLKDRNKIIYIIGELDDKGRTQFLIKSIKFECPSCGNIIHVMQNSEKVKAPSRCGCGRKGKFKVLHEEMSDTLSLIIRDLHENLNLDQGIEPVKAVCNYELEAFETLNPGDKLQLVGVLRDMPVFSKTGGQKTTRDKIIEIVNLKKLNKFYTDFHITEEDENQIKEISNDPINWFQKSFFDDLYGVDLQTKATTIAVFGDLHLLAVGLPGRGKSTHIKRWSQIKLKGSFVDVVKSSPSGIIGTATPNPFTGKYSLDGGALKPLHPFGLLGVDELDKDVEGQIQKHLMGVISDGELNIHKANNRVREPCDITVWGSCNLKNGKSEADMNRTEAENFNIIPPLWDRFDLKIYYNNYVDWNRPEMVKELLSSSKKNWNPDEEKLTLAKKYQQRARQINVKFDDNHYAKLAQLGESFVRKLEKTASFRVLNTMKKILEGLCRLHLREKPIDEDFRIMTDLVANLDIERNAFLLGSKPNVSQVRAKVDTYKKDQVKNYILMNPDCNIEDVQKATGLDFDQCDKIVSKLKNQGEIYEPKKNKFMVL
ncbi:MAG: hypothetical protein R6U11_00640 [Bacteroidales bacterium]